MRSRWTKDQLNRLREVAENARFKTEGFKQIAEETGHSLRACHHAYYKHDHNKANIIFNTPKAVRVYRKNLKKYSGNLRGEAFPKIAKSLNRSAKTIENVYYGRRSSYRTYKCYRYNLKPSFCLLNLGDTFHRKNFNSVPEKHTKKSVLEIIKSIFKF